MPATGSPSASYPPSCPYCLSQACLKTVHQPNGQTSSRPDCHWHFAKLVVAHDCMGYFCVRCWTEKVSLISIWLVQEELHQLFMQLDRDGNGSLDIGEFRGDHTFLHSVQSFSESRQSCAMAKGEGGRPVADVAPSFFPLVLAARHQFQP